MLSASATGDVMAGPLKATFFAFRKRERSGVLLGATIAFVIGLAVLLGAFVALFWSSLGPAVAWHGQIIQAAAANDTAAMQNVTFPTGLFSMIGALMLWLFPIYILCAAYEAACLRWMIHGETQGFMGLSLGAPTWRVWSVYWIWFLLNIAFSIAMSILMGVVMGMFFLGANGDPNAVLTAQIPFYIIQYALMAYFGIRLAPAAAASIARRKFAFFDAWTVTKGRFFPLLGSYLIIFVLYIIVSLIMAVAWFTIILGPSAPDLAAAANDPARLTEMMTAALQSYLQSLAQPQAWVAVGVLQLIGFAVMAFFYLAMYGISARAAQAALEDGAIQPAQ